MGAKVFLHVGAPKTGTTYLQDRLFLNRSSLAKHGIKYPTGLREDHFLAALDLTGIKWPGFAEKAEGEWDGLVRRAKLATGTVVLSHEVLAVAKPSRIRKAASDLGGLDNSTELHVVFTARDITRQLTADWQEGLKMYGTKSFRRYLREVKEGDPRTSKVWFWRAQHIPRVLSNWGAIVPPERIHLVVLPRSGGDVWEMFSQVIGADPTWAPRESDRRNSSIGAGEATLLRQLNQRLKAAGLERATHRRLVLDAIVYDTISERESEPIMFPPASHEWARDVAQEWTDWVAASGIDVIGDPADLLPGPPTDAEWRNPDRPGPKAVRDAALDALVGITLEAANRPDPEASLRRRAARAARRLAKRPGR
ncbi:hypothetical protein [Nocardioides terrae]|nr:hypothetical protein [Nocardioides terrae]